MFGRSKKTAPKPAVVLGGVAMTGIGGLLSFAMVFGERAPDAPLWAIIVGFALAFGGLACGLYLLIAGLRMP